MSAQVISYDDVAWAQRWDEDLLRVCVKDLGICGPLDRHDGLEAMQGEGRNHGEVGAIVLWHGPNDPLPTGRAPEPTRHGQVHARFVDKFEALEIERLNQRLVVHPGVLDSLGVALGRVERRFLRGNPKRRTSRHMVGTLTRIPVISAARVHNSSQVASG
jgi:hypothetical protein